MHVLIVGTTMSGKSSLARKLLQKSKSEGRYTLVLDALYDPAWREAGADYMTNNPVEFLNVVKQNKNCSVFVDEAGEYCDRYSKDMFYLATQARHKGHQSFFITQRANMVSVNIRNNCSQLFCFNTRPSDAKLLADDFVCDGVLDAPNFKQGECLFVSRFQESKKLNVFT